MAILFGRVSNITRGSGGSAIKAAAYRSCSKLSLSITDKETNITVDLVSDYLTKKGLSYSQIHAPENAPDWVYDRQSLWQRVEDVETKENARLAGEYTMALPKEFSVEENIELIKEFAEEVFVSRGIVVDVNFHNDNQNNPHVHFMYALRQLVEKTGGEIDFSSHRFRELQSRAFLEGVIKEAHKNIQNKHLEQNGFEQRLEWGVAHGQEATIHHGGIKEVVARNQQIIFRNAQKIIADPTIVIDKLDFNKAVFSKEDIEKELEKSLLITLKNAPVADQTALDIYIKNELVGLLDTVLMSPKLTLINPHDLKGRMLFAKTEQVELEKRFIENVSNLAKGDEHNIGIKEHNISQYAPGKDFSNQQKEAIVNICNGGNLSVLEGWPGAGKSTVTKEIARHYIASGYEVIAAAPTNKAAQELASKLGVNAYTTSALRMKWQYDRGQEDVSIGLASSYYKDPFYDLKEGPMEKKTLLILDEASMIDVATSDYFTSEVLKSGAKLLALGDNNQNQAIGAKGGFARMGEIGDYNVLTEVNRHQNSNATIRALHMEATSALCGANISKAISIYEQLGKINLASNEEEKEALIARSYVTKLMSIAKGESIDISEAAKQVVISSYTNAEIANINGLIRESLKSSGVLLQGASYRSGGIHGKSSMVELSVGDRIIFTSNARDEEGRRIVLNNELATVKKLISVDDMGRGEFLVDVEGGSGIRSELIKTGVEGRPITFKHGYAVTNHAVQGASVAYKLYSIDQYSGYSSLLVGLTRHKIDCEIFAAIDTLENQVYKTKDLDVEKVRENYRAIGYEYVEKTGGENKSYYEKTDIPLWKLGLHLIASKKEDLSFAIDSSYTTESVELQKEYMSASQQLELMREELNKHNAALSEYELLANTQVEDENIASDANKSTNKLSSNKKPVLTGFEQSVSEHFVLKDNIIIDIEDILGAPVRFKLNEVIKIEDHIASLKNGIITSGNSERLNWSDLSKEDQDLVLWSYIDKEDRERLTSHLEKSQELTSEIPEKAKALSSIWQELHESGFKQRDLLTGNYKIAKEYLIARKRVVESFKQNEIFNRELASAKVQKALIAAIDKKYSIKLKYISATIDGMNNAEKEFIKVKEDSDSQQLNVNPNYKIENIVKYRESYLTGLKKGEFKNIVGNSNLFVLDILEDAKPDTELGKVAEDIYLAKDEAAGAKAERTRTARIMVENDHVSEEFELKQPSFAKILASLNINQHTLQKHAELTTQKHYFEKIVDSSLGERSDYKEMMRGISKAQSTELTIEDITALLKSHDSLCEYVELVNEHIEDLKSARLSTQNILNSGKIRLAAIENYKNKELPYFLGSLYKEDEKTLMSNLDSLLNKADDKSQLASVIGSNPEMLGSVKGHGVIAKIFNSKQQQLVENNIGQLADRMARYIKEEKEMSKLGEVSDGSLLKKLSDIDKQIGVLRSSLPSDIEINILEKIGSLQNFVTNSDNQDREIGKFTKNINELFASDEAQDALFSYQVNNKVFFAGEDNNRAIKKTKAQNVKSNKEISVGNDNLKSYLQVRSKEAEQKAKISNANYKNKQNKPQLTFADVKAGLNQSVITDIFHRYGPMMNSDAKIERKGDQLKLGSLYMSTSGSKAGLWNRFSRDGSKGDIFRFVEMATGCSKHEALEIVASHAGVAPNANNLSGNIKKIEVEATQVKKYKLHSRKAHNTWVASTIVPVSASKFKPEKDLSFLIKQGSEITNTYEYRNIDNELLGYTVRIIEKSSGNKQVLPVAYCYNEAKGKSRWQLKGISDNGTKPIYKLEQISTNLEKPILIVEGEKTADKAQELLSDYNVVSWIGGAGAVDKVDWSKLKDKVVSIWPDNDEAGMAAARKIVNHIDCQNGFKGLVSIVDTKKLSLPEKWDLADNVPDTSNLANIGINGAIEEARVNIKSIGDELQVSRGDINKENGSNRVLDSIEMLTKSSKLHKDEYISKAVYSNSINAIAASKGQDLGNIEDHKEFIRVVNDVSYEYQSLQSEYGQRQLQGQSEAQVHATKNQLFSKIVRDISILHQVQLRVRELPKIHLEHIELAASEQLKNISDVRLNDSDKEMIANNVYKVVSSKEWAAELDDKQVQVAHSISVKYTAKTIDEFLSNDTAMSDLANIRTIGIDESGIFASFKEDYNKGIDALKVTSDKVTMASGFADENKAIIEEAKRFGYGADHAETVRSLVGMDKQEANRTCLEIRDRCISEHLENKIDKTLQSFEIEKLSAKTSEEVISIIAKEQSYLSEMHDNIKSPKYHRKEIYQATLAAKTNMEKSIIDGLDKELAANQKQGIKSNEELVAILKNPEHKVSEIYENLHSMAKNERHKVLQWYSHEMDSLQKMGSKIDYDKLVNTLTPMSTEDRKVHINVLTATETKKYVEPMLAHHSEEKEKAKNTKELIEAIAKEQATYMHLHNDHGMAIYALDKSNGNMNLSLIASAANDVHKLGGINYVQKIIDHAIDHNIKKDKKLFDELKNSKGNLKILAEDLKRECKIYHRNQIDRHLNDLSKNRDVFVGNRRFSNKSEYLNHLKNHHNHDYMPTNVIDKHLQQIHDVEQSKQAAKQQERQKDLHLNKNIGGPGL